MNKGKLIQLIHVFKNKLAMDDETYRTMLVTMTGKTSTRDMEIVQLNSVIKTLKCGSQVRSVCRRPAASYPQAKKLRALWLNMYAAGIVRDRSDVALCAWLKRETGIDRIEWLMPDKASAAIEKLKQWQKRCQREE